MKKVINGKIYDTDKATKICALNQGNGISDVYWAEFELYQTLKSKRFFIAGKGGPLSLFGKPSRDGGWDSGEGIIPISEEKALELCEKKGLPPEEISKCFEIEEA